MDANTFWTLIDRSLQAAGPDPDAQLEHLEALLLELEPAEIVEFDRLFSGYYRNAYTWPLWGAAYVMEGGCSDDGFMDFRGWLVARGRKVYEAALAEPDSLAAFVAEDQESQVEGFLSLARRAWAEVTGEDEDQFPSDGTPHPGEPAGTPWQEDELDERFPALARKFG